MSKQTHGAPPSAATAEAAARRVADEMGFELVEVTLQKESRGKCLCIYVDKDGGITLDDCERYHKAVMPLLESVDYDFLDVSSPGVDRPVKTLRDFEKRRGDEVEARLFAPHNGAKVWRGTLEAMDEQSVTLRLASGESLVFPRKAVALIKPVIVFDDDEPDGEA